MKIFYQQMPIDELEISILESMQKLFLSFEKENNISSQLIQQLENKLQEPKDSNHFPFLEISPELHFIDANNEFGIISYMTNVFSNLINYTCSNTFPYFSLKNDVQKNQLISSFSDSQKDTCVLIQLVSKKVMLTGYSIQGKMSGNLLSWIV
jgi:hypothetical protein